MNNEARTYWAACAGIDGLGRKTFERILVFKYRYELSWPATWKQILANNSKLDLTQKQWASAIAFDRIYSPASYFDWLTQHQIQVLTSEDKEYPILLQQIDDKPFVLFIKGRWQWDKLPIAVVGTRRATGYGRMATTKIATELVGAGATIISGFMYGIDTLAHQAALAHGGQTVGVLGFGFDHFFPKSHAKLFEQYLAQGMTFVTEYPPHVVAFPSNFPVRNRIVAGMSLATIVTEAAADSGSLITAQLALDYNRLVCAVPGSITSPYCAGTKWLINQGAKFISSGYEVLEELQYQVVIPAELLSKPTAKSKRKAKKRTENKLIWSQLDNQLQKDIYHQLCAQSLAIDDLSKELSVPVPQVIVELSLMELGGIVSREGEVWGLK